jgi:GT2 family glycosyltransferase
MDVSVVIVSWNTRDLLRDCLNSIIRETCVHSFEIFVIDNASRDGSSEMVLDEFPSVHLIKNKDNSGFAAANNQGIRESIGRYVLLLNPDTYILDNAIGRCIQYGDKHLDVGIIGCQVYLDNRSIQQTGFAFPSPWNLFLTLSGLSRLFPRSRVLGAPELGWWNRDSEMDLDVVSGMFMLIRSEALRQVGFLDDSYFVYTEEADLCFRFAKAGWRRVFTPSARIIHICGGSMSTSQVSVKMFVQMQKSTMIYLRKNLGLSAWITAKVIYIVSDVVRGLGWLGMSIFRGDTGLWRKSAAALAAVRFHLFGVEPI